MLDQIEVSISSSVQGIQHKSRRPTTPESGVVRLWRLRTDVDPLTIDQISWLSESELTRARSYAREGDRNSYVYRRSTLRQILGDCFGRPPQALTISTVPHGKPTLLDGALSFNCAFSDNHVLIAIASDMSIDVDLQRVRWDLDWRAVAHIAFHPDESIWINDQSDSASTFTDLWTRREALFKAWGKGLHDGMATINLTVDDTLASLINSPGRTSWWLSPLTVIPGYRAALASSSPVRSIEIIENPFGGLR